MIMFFLFSIVLIVGLLALSWNACRDQLRDMPRPHWIALSAISLTALIVRLIYLSQSSLEHLEATYLFEATKPDGIWELITSRQAAEQMHQPLYTLLLRGWASISTDEGFLRLPSALFSVACVPLTYGLLRNARAPQSRLWAAALTAAAPLLVWYGRDCTPYALLAMLSLAAMVSALKTIDTPSRWGAIRTALLLSLAFYTHFHGGWIAVTVVLWLALHKDRRKVLIDTTAVTALCTLPWVPALFEKLATSVEGLSEDSTLMRFSHEPLEATNEAFRILLGGPTPGWVLVLCLVIVGTVALVRQRRPLGSLIVIALGIGLLAEAHILWQLNRSKGIVYVDVRHYIYLVPLLSAAIVSFPTGRPTSIFRPAAVITLALHLWTAWPMVTSLEKPDVRSAVAYVNSQAGPDQGIGFLPAPWYQPILEHYLLGSCPELIHARSHEGWWRFDNCEQLEKPEEGTVFGFPPTPERLLQAAQRLELKRLWVIDIRDHRFGLPVPPTTPQERFLCWDCREKARLQEPVFFGKWVVVEAFDARKLQTCTLPPVSEASRAVRTVTSKEAWKLECRN